MEASDTVDFDAFAKSRAKSLWYAAWLLTGDHHKAEDLVQTALAKTFSRFTTMDTPAFEAYVRTTIYRTFVSWWRRRWGGERPAESLPEVIENPVDPALKIDLARALADLPKLQRAVLVMRYFDDLTEAQTAEALGISLGSVKGHAYRACASLRESAHLQARGTQS